MGCWVAHVAVIGVSEVANARVLRCLRGFEAVGFSGLRAKRGPSSSHLRVVVFCLETIGHDELGAIKATLRDIPLADVIVVTRFTPTNVRQLSAVPEILHQVMDFDEVPMLLRARVSEFLNQHYLDRAAERVVGLLELPPIARLFVRRAWRATRPPTSVMEANRRIGVHASTLRDNWPFAATPKVLLEWGLLGRATAARNTGVSWAWASTRAGISRRRLERIALRRVGCTLRQIDGFGPGWVEGRFVAWLTEEIPEAGVGERAG